MSARVVGPAAPQQDEVPGLRWIFVLPALAVLVSATGEVHGWWLAVFALPAVLGAAEVVRWRSGRRPRKRVDLVLLALQAWICTASVVLAVAGGEPKPAVALAVSLVLILAVCALVLGGFRLVARGD